VELTDIFHSLTCQYEGRESERTETKPADTAWEDNVSNEGLAWPVGLLHDHRGCLSDDQLLRLLLWRSCRWVVGNCCMSGWSCWTHRCLLRVIATWLLLLLMMIMQYWWIKALGLCRRYMRHDCKLYRSTDDITSMKQSQLRILKVSK